MTKDEKLKKFGIVVPEGTDAKVVDLLIKQAEDAEKLQAEGKNKDEQLKSAVELAKKQEEQLLAKEAELADKADGFGTFKVGTKEFVICNPQTRLPREQTIVTYKDLLNSPTLQKQFVESGYGMVAPKEKWVAERKRLSALAKGNRQVETPATVKIIG